MLSAKLKEAAGNSADATLYVDDVFSTWLYDGAGASQTVDNGIDLAGKGGLVWIKQRNGPSAHNLRDTARGNNYSLISSLTNAQSSGWSTVFNFTSTGYAITGTNDQYNGAGGTYASWTFRKAAKFFDVVTYTGTGSARTIAHSLGVAPGMVIVKRTDVSADWQVYSNGLTSAANSIQLNLTNAQASAPTVWNSTAPTSSVFSVGTDSTVNASGGTYVAYLYAHDTSSTGIIQCGSLTTDGSGNATVNLGWEPQYLLAKKSGMADDWYVVDSMRGFTQSASDAIIRPNTSGAETNYNYGFERPTATGFEFKGMGDTRTYIYMAIRRPNKPPTTGTQVFYSQYAGETASTPLVFNSPFAPDLIIDRFRVTEAYSPSFVDRLRGSDNQLLSASTSAEATGSNFIRLDGVGGTGYIPAMGYANNNSGNMYDARVFKRAPGFFDEVCYTGTGSATTQAHNLGVAPELMIVKNRTVTRSWTVYSSTLGATQFLLLNFDYAGGTDSTYWNNTAPTSSVFTVGINQSVNYPSNNFVAYLFATLAGISKVGSYTGNGTGQAIACGFSGGARFVLIKRYGATGDWYTFDSARGLTSGSSPYLLLNSTAAEVTGNNGVYASTGGFTLGATASTTTNINGASYIYLSVA